MDRALHAADILDDWAAAIRGDWGSIDGRTCRMQLETIGAYLRDACDELTLSDVGVCTFGGAHWIGAGFDHDCYEVGKDDG